MKGYGIYVQNDLLEPKHVKNIGKSIWLYMWLIDKMTGVDEYGIGIVLGGRPIQFYEINSELGISSDVYTEWVKKLEKYPYIQTKRTPYGIVFKLLKPKKRFRQMTREIPTNDRGDSGKTRNVLYTVSNNTIRIAKADTKRIGELLDLNKPEFLKIKR
jgi:DNA-binding HxlR family transcriptional regulator